MIYKESSPESETKWAELIRVRTKRWWWLIIVGFQFTHNTLYTAECARELPSCSSVQPKKLLFSVSRREREKPTITYDMCSCIRFNCFWSSQLFKAICSLALSYLLRASISSPPRLAACSHTSLWASSTRKLNSIKASERVQREEQNETMWRSEWERERNYLKFNYTWKRKHWEMFCYLMKASKRRRWTTALFRFFSSSSPPHYSAVIIHTWKKIDAKLCEGSYKKKEMWKHNLKS